MKARKTWRDKLADNQDLPEAVQIAGRRTTRRGTGTVIIPALRKQLKAEGHTAMNKGRGHSAADYKPSLVHSTAR